MKKKSASRSAFFNPRFLISFAFCAIGAVLTLVAFALYPGGTAMARENRPSQQRSITQLPVPIEAMASEWDEDLARGMIAPEILTSVPAQNSAAPSVITATFVVNTTADTVDVAPGDGTCGDSTGACSLRAAIMEANALAGDDIITLPAGTYTQTLVAANEDANAGGDWDINSNITINGAGAATTILQANAAPATATERVMEVVGAANVVTINGVTLRHGNKTGAPATATRGGGIRNAGTLTMNNCTVTLNNASGAGGVRNDRTITLNNVTVSNNACNNGATTCFGGGMYNTLAALSTVTINGCLFSNNTSTSPGANGFGFAAGLGIESTTGFNLVITNSSFSGNQGVGNGTGGSNGNGIRMLPTATSTANITDSSFSTNSGSGGSSIQGSGIAIFTGLGGTGTVTGTWDGVTVTGNTGNAGGTGIFVNATSSPITIDLRNSTISNNTGGTTGGGMALTNVGGAAASLVTFNILNSTISGNTVSGNGGGLYVEQPVAAAAVTANLNFVTVANNTAGTGGGIFRSTAGTVNLKNSILADNTAPTGPNISGVITSQNFNHIEDPIGGTFAAMANDVVAGDPALGPLANNGGNTSTHLPGAGSIVLNTIPNGTNDCGTTVTRDQRGASFVRPSGAGCEKGSVEVQAGGGSSPTPTPPGTPTPPPTPSPTASVAVTPTPTASASATPCGSAVTFSNPAAIALTDCPSGCPAPQPASLYPSNITVSGVTGPVTKVTVTVTGYSHTFPADSDMLLVGPGGQKFILASDVIGGTDAVGINWTFDDTAAAFIGSTGTPASGTFKPSNYTTCQDTWPAPAPAGAYLSPGGIGTPCGTDTLAAFNGVDPNGTWSLYIADDANIDSGTISGGWSLSITTAGAGCPSPTPSATATPGTPSPTPSCPPTITQSSTQTITPLNSVSCNNGTGHTDNSYWRAFTMNSFVGANAYNVTSVSFGIEQATGAGGTQPITVRLHTSNQPFPTGFPGSLTQIATTTINVPDSASNTIFTVPIAATVPANSQLVMEVFTPDGTVAGNLLFMGSNADPESGPSYLSAAGCGITAPTTTAAIGFPNMHLVFNVNGSCGGGATPTPGTPTPTSTVPPPSATPSTTPCSGGADVIVDGGFENGGIPSSTWDPETSTNFGTPLCDDASCGTGGGASPPRTGLIWAWFGGIAAPETATIGQTVTIPSGGPASLHFWMRVGTVNAPFDDVMNVRVDGTIVQSFIEPATAETDYTERVIDLTSFANGASHVVLFEYIGTSSAVGSYVIDDVSLITGGCASPTPGITPTPSATIAPSPCPPAWTAGPNAPPVAILRAPGTYFPGNGRFYSIGGRSSDLAGSDFTNPFEYDPATNAWTTKPSTLPDAQVNNMACGVLTVSGTDQIYCVGGSQATIVGNASRVFSYNPATDTFTTLAAGDDWPGSQAGAFLPGGFAVAGNKLYIIGSFNANSVPPSMTAQVWQFDPTAAVGSKWLARADFPVARGYVPAATIGGIIYTGGGAALDPTGTLIDSVESFKYDPVANTWTPIANIPRATGETRAVVMNGQMWVLGGGRVAPNPGNQVDIYDPVANTWSAGLPFDAVGRRNFPADSDGTSRIFLAGGYDNAAVQVNTMRIFGPGPCASPSPTPPTTPTPSATVTPTTPTPPPATPTPSITPPTGTPTPTVTPPASPTPGISPPAQPVNFSTRMHVEGGDRVGIGGFIVTGAAPKRLIVRAIGPSLTRQGLIDVLADPVLELHGPTGFITITNDNWRDTQEVEIQATGLPPTNNLESAIVATLPPGNYTAIVRANGPTPLARSGLALVEVYDLDETVGKLGNISTRAFCGTEDNIIIAGFILGNNGGDDNVIARGMGPSLAAQGVPSPLADPTLQLRDANGALLSSNNDWQDNPTQAAIISGAGLAPGNPLEAGIAATLPPGLYTALLAGLNGGTGIGLVEVYDRGDGTGGPTPTPGLPTPTPTPGVPTPTPTPGAPTPTPTPPSTPTPPPSSPTPTPAVACTENFDGVVAPALPSGWSQTIVTGPPPAWATSTGTPDTAPNDAFVTDTAVISDKVLDRSGVAINSAAPVLSFRNNYDTEFSDGTFWDGGVLEVSSPNINGGAFTDVTDAAVGGSFVSGEYSGTIDNTANNPLAKRDAWSGSSSGYVDTVVNLGPNLNGQTVTLRWRMGTDEAIGSPGWRIDTLSLVGGSCP